MIELLVVIAIIVILAGLLLPAVSRSKARARSIMCMNNYKHLALSWTMYSTDNSDHLAYNQAPNPQTRMFAAANTPPAPNWVNNIMDWELTPGNTNLDFVNQSLLAPYVSSATAVFHCPEDHALSSVQLAAGWSGRVRSVSMNAMVGDPGAILQSGANLANPGYEQFIKENDFKDPAAIFVFLDEHPDSINDGYFLNPPETLEWVDLPGSYHNGAGSFSFADGHTEIHRWQSPSTVRPPVPDGAKLVITLATNDSADFAWMARHASFPVQ